MCLVCLGRVMILPSETTVSHRYYQCTVVFYGYVMVCLFICICIHTHIYIYIVYIYILYIYCIYIYTHQIVHFGGFEFHAQGFSTNYRVGFQIRSNHGLLVAKAHLRGVRRGTWGIWRSNTSLCRYFGDFRQPGLCWAGSFAFHQSSEWFQMSKEKTAGIHKHGMLILICTTRKAQNGMMTNVENYMFLWSNFNIF